MVGIVRVENVTNYIGLNILCNIDESINLKVY